MQKKIFTFFLLLFMSSCGYEAIHSKKKNVNYNFSIDKLNFTGDREANLKIKEKLNNYTLKQENKNFVLKIYSIYKKRTLAKDTSGDATNFEITIVVNVDVLMNNKLKSSFAITENFSYNNSDNKFDLKRHEKEIKNNLSEILTQKLIFRLSNIQ